MYTFELQHAGNSTANMWSDSGGSVGAEVVPICSTPTDTSPKSLAAVRQRFRGTNNDGVTPTTQAPEKTNRRTPAAAGVTAWVTNPTDPSSAPAPTLG